MKKTVVIMGHPDLEGASLANRIVVDRLAARPDVEIRPLKTLYPDFDVDVAAEQAALVAADRIVLQFPFHWYSVPGILKEWIDRVLAYGFAYGSTGDKLKGKELLLSFTVGGPEEAYRREGYNTYRIEELIAPLKQTSNLIGTEWLEPVYTHAMVYIEGVYNVKEEVEARAREHADRLEAALDA